MMDRGHLDHFALDGMHIEVDWVRDPSLQGFHAPRPLEEALR